MVIAQGGGVAADSQYEQTVTVTGAADGDLVRLAIPNALMVAKVVWQGWVSAANTVKVRVNNVDEAGTSPALAGTIKVFVEKV